MEESLEGFVFWQCQEDVVGGAEEKEVFVVGTEHAVVLHPVRSHDGSVPLLYLLLYLLGVFITVETHVVVKLPSG